MNQSLASLLTGNQKTLSLNLKSGSGASFQAGDLVALTVEKSSADGSTSLSVAGQSLELSLEGALPEGSKILARVEGGEKQTQLKLLDTLREFKQIQTRELMKLIRPMDVKSTSEILDQVRNQLRHRGFFEPGKLSRPGESSPKTSRAQAGSARADNRGQVIRLSRALPESENIQQGENIQAHVSEVNSDHKITLEIKGRSVEARVSEQSSFKPGDILQLSVVENGDEPKLEVLNTMSDAEPPESKIRSLLKELQIKPDREAVQRTANIIHSNPEESPERTMRRLSVPPEPRREFSAENIQRAKSLIQSHGQTGAIPADSEPLRNLFENLNIEVNEKSIKTAERILKEQPDIKPREFLRQLTSELKSQPSDPFKEFNPKLLRQARDVIERVSARTSDSSSKSPPRENQNAPASSSASEAVRSREDSIKNVLADMNRSTSTESVKQVQQFIQDNPEAKPVKLLQYVRDNVPMNKSINQEKAETIVKELRQFFQQVDRRETLPPKNEIDRSDLKAMIKDLGMKPDKSVVNLAESLLEIEDRPSKRLLAQVLTHRNLAQDSEGNVDQDRLKKLVSMLKRDFPVNEKFFNQVARETSMEKMAQIWNNQNNLPRVQPGEGNLKQQLQQLLKMMGFDFESMVHKNTEEATKTLRAALMNMLGGGDTSQVSQSMTGDMSQSDARSTLSQIVKHALASKGDDGSIYLFIPFQDGDQSRMMQVRFEDQRDDDRKKIDSKWGVTLEVTLSMIGDLRIHARRRKDKLGIRFEADQSKTVRLIRDNREMLTNKLTDLGYDSQVKVERMEGGFSDWVDRNLYDVPESGTGSLDLTI